MQIPLVVVGNGHQYKEEVQKYIQKTNLTHQVIFINNLQDPLALQAFYQRAKIFIYPSYYEGFGLPVTEALLSKVPVITSNRSSLPEAGGADSYYINPDSPEEIACAIETILSDTAKREQMIEKGFQFAHQQFNVQQLTAQVHQLYHKICSAHE
jgi:glycosyltransferase involved in cell wall biosynthesis